MEYTLARSRFKFDEQEAYMATAFSVRDRLIESWNDTNTYFKWVMKASAAVEAGQALVFRPRVPSYEPFPFFFFEKS